MLICNDRDQPICCLRSIFRPEKLGEGANLPKIHGRMVMKINAGFDWNHHLACYWFVPFLGY